MAKVKKVTQIRYYNDKNPNNSDSSVTYRKLVAGSIFSQTLPIIQLGIQTLPGQKFYLNNSTSPVVVGSTGIYELDVDGITEITALSFDAKTLQLVVDNASAFLIVDIIYLQEENE